MYALSTTTDNVVWHYMNHGRDYWHIHQCLTSSGMYALCNNYCMYHPILCVAVIINMLTAIMNQYEPIISLESMSHIFRIISYSRFHQFIIYIFIIFIIYIFIIFIISYSSYTYSSYTYSSYSSYTYSSYTGIPYRYIQNGTVSVD